MFGQLTFAGWGREVASVDSYLDFVGHRLMKALVLTESMKDTAGFGRLGVDRDQGVFPSLDLGGSALVLRKVEEFDV